MEVLCGKRAVIQRRRLDTGRRVRTLRVAPALERPPTVHVMTESKTLEFQAEVSQVLSLVINSLYSHKEIFLRELVSNASDALDRLRFRALQQPDLLESGHTPTIRLLPDSEAGTLTIWDNGIGMTADELAKSLGTIAWSGSKEFLRQLKDAKSAEAELRLIGQFGVGFYSAFLVADSVEVVSRAAGQGEAHRWRSDGKQSFTVEPAEREEHGTSVILHLKEEEKGLLDGWRLRELIRRYSDFVSHKIELLAEKPAAQEGEEPKTELETINQASALWQRSPKDVSKEQYEDFYKHLGHDWEPPLGWRHFHIEGTQMFAGLLYVPRHQPFGLFADNEEKRHGVRLHVRRVFVMDNCEDLVPRWLRFVKGVVDSEDLPLNVSRETLQDSRAVRTIKKQVVSQVLDLLSEIASERHDDYVTFWQAFGSVLKEGLHFEPQYKDKLLPLLRYESSTQVGLVSLSEYVTRMKGDQEVIYYATGVSRHVIESGPHLESVRKRGFEVLLMTEPVDPFVVGVVKEFEGKKLVNVMEAELSSETDKAESETQVEAKPVLERFKEALGDKVAEVRVSTRLTDSPACLVTPEGGIPPHVELLMRAQKMDVPPTRRILELNLEHPLLGNLTALMGKDTAKERVAEWIELVYDQALLAEGSPLPNPAKFAKSVASLLTDAAAKEAAGSQG